MKTFLETIGELLLEFVCIIIQLIAVIIGGIGMLFCKIDDLLSNVNYKLLGKTGRKAKEKVVNE